MAERTQLRVHIKAQLRQAYALIKDGQKVEAFDLIRPVLAQQPDNVDAWWLAVYAAPGPREAAFACQKVLTLKPDHWPAQQMLAEQQRQLAISSVLSEVQLDPAQPIPLKQVRPTRKRSPLRQILILLGILVIVMGGFVLVVNLTGNNFGLPIGGAFSGNFELSTTGMLQLAQVDKPVVPLTVYDTLIVGAQHDYRFYGQADVSLFASVKFSGVGDSLPGESVKLIDPDGYVIASAPDGVGMVGVLYADLTKSGTYTLRLTGTAGKAQGPYMMQFALARVNTLDELER